MTANPLDRLAELQRRYTGPIPKHKLAPLLANATVLEMDIACAHAAIALCERHLATHSHMTDHDRDLCQRQIVASRDWLGRVGAQAQAAE